MRGDGWVIQLAHDQAAEEVVADVRELSEDEQDRIADVMIAFLHEWQDDPLRVA